MQGRCVFPECKTITLRDGNWKYCDLHRIKIKKTYMKVYNNFRRDYDIIKCQMCDNLFEDKNGRVTCSSFCRDNKWWVIRNIKQRRNTIKKKQRELVEMEKKYGYLL